MFELLRGKRRTTLALAAGVAGAMILPAAASAQVTDTDSTSVSVGAGGSDVTPGDPGDYDNPGDAIGSLQVGNFATVTVSAAAQPTTASITDFLVEDLRGTQAGWNVSLSATDFEAGDQGTDIPASALSLAAGDVYGIDGSSTAGLGDVTGGTFDGTVSVLNAPVGTGAGAFGVDFGGLTLTVPGNSLVDTYTSTMTLTLASSPNS